MYLIIDNYDSFVYNLAAYLQELNQKIVIVKNDCITLQQVSAMHPRGIIISPGPKSPASAGISEAIVREFSDSIPILGVCLGHQIIAHTFGAEIVRGTRPMHGKVTPVSHNGSGLFSEIPSPYNVTRYHSLVINPDSLPNCLQRDAADNLGTIMAVSHKHLPVYGVQFHPEALLSEYGHELLTNFLHICNQWWLTHEKNR